MQLTISYENSSLLTYSRNYVFTHSPHRPIRMRRMRAENPCRLKEQRVFRRDVAVFVLILQAKAQELAPIPTDVGRDTPHFLLLIHRVLRVVPTAAEIP